jgi:hypothetical protein
MRIDEEVPVKFYDLPLIAVTRVALGIGIGLLIANQFDDHSRRNVGAGLVWFGALTTVPLALHVLSAAGAFEKGSGDTSDLRWRGRERNLASQATATW